jgi:hypothetical protein
MIIVTLSKFKFSKNWAPDGVDVLHGIVTPQPGHSKDLHTWMTSIRPPLTSGCVRHNLIAKLLSNAYYFFMKPKTMVVCSWLQFWVCAAAAEVGAGRRRVRSNY